MYSNPTLRPATARRSTTRRSVQEHVQPDQQPATTTALPRAYRERYPPGSTFKIVTTQVGARHRHRDPDTPVPRHQDGFHDPGHQHDARGTSAARRAAARSRRASSSRATRRSPSSATSSATRSRRAMQQCGIDERAADRPVARSAVESVGPRRRATTSRRSRSPASARATSRHVAARRWRSSPTASPTAASIMEPHVVHGDPRRRRARRCAPSTPKEWKTCMPPATAATLTNMMVQVVQRRAPAPRRQIDGRHRRGQDRHRADRRARREPARVVHRLRARPRRPGTRSR